jgi:hypothetical protein
MPVERECTPDLLALHQHKGRAIREADSLVRIFDEKPCGSQFIRLRRPKNLEPGIGKQPARYACRKLVSSKPCEICRRLVDDEVAGENGTAASVHHAPSSNCRLVVLVLGNVPPNERARVYEKQSASLSVDIVMMKGSILGQLSFVDNLFVQKRKPPPFHLLE